MLATLGSSTPSPSSYVPHHHQEHLSTFVEWQSAFLWNINMSKHKIEMYQAYNSIIIGQSQWYWLNAQTGSLAEFWQQIIVRNHEVVNRFSNLKVLTGSNYQQFNSEFIYLSRPGASTQIMMHSEGRGWPTPTALFLLHHYWLTCNSDCLKALSTC